MIYRLMQNQPSPDPGPTFDIKDAIEHPQGVFQVQNSGGSGGGTVVLEGRVSVDAPWATLTTVTLTGTQSQLIAVAVVTQMRARVTSAPIGASFQAWLQAH